MDNKNHSFSAVDRAELTSELRDDIYDLIHEHGSMATLTIPEVIGVLEILKHELLIEQMAARINDEDEDDDDDN